MENSFYLPYFQIQNVKIVIYIYSLKTLFLPSHVCEIYGRVLQCLILSTTSPSFNCHIAIHSFAKTLALRLAVVDCKHGSKPVDVF